MLSSQLVNTICQEFYKNVQAASKSASCERSEWRTAIAIESEGLARVCSDNFRETVDEVIDDFQRNVWQVVGLDRMDCADHDDTGRFTGDTDSLDSFESAI